MIDKDQNNNLSAVDRKLEHFEAVNSKDFIFIINIDSMAIISYATGGKNFGRKNRVLQVQRDRVLLRYRGAY